MVSARDIMKPYDCNLRLTHRIKNELRLLCEAGVTSDYGKLNCGKGLGKVVLCDGALTAAQVQ